jgi:hypothetical protein
LGGFFAQAPLTPFMQKIPVTGAPVEVCKV